jgi:hypothetical protein
MRWRYRRAALEMDRIDREYRAVLEVDEDEMRELAREG